jgi:hypothetical protein
MRITILGGWGKNHNEIEKWELQKQDKFNEACQAIGKELARRSQTIIVGDDDPVSADHHIVKGILAADDHSGSRIEVIEPYERRLFEKEWQESDGSLFVHHSFSEVSSESAGAKIISVGKADAVLTIAGMRKTYDAGLASLVSRKTLVPIGSFGGASRKLLDAIDRLGETENLDKLRTLNGLWSPVLIDTALDLLGITHSGKPRAFIGSSSEGLEVAKKLQTLLRDSLEVEVWNEDTVFGLGAATLEALERAVSVYDVGIFVFTPDDQLHTRGVVKPVARDNVIFELGLFTGRLTRWRAFVVHPSKKTIELPTDLSGITTAPYDGNKCLDDALKPVCKSILKAITEASSKASSRLR